MLLLLVTRLCLLGVKGSDFVNTKMSIIFENCTCFGGFFTLYFFTTKTTIATIGTKYTICVKIPMMFVVCVFATCLGVYEVQ